MVTKLGVITNEAVVAPVLQLYVAAPEATMVLFSPLHIAVREAMAVTLGFGNTATWIDAELGQFTPSEVLNAVREYTLVVEGVTKMPAVVNQLLQLYVLACEATNVAEPPAQSVVDPVIPSVGAKTEMPMVCVLLHPLVVPVTVYTLFMVGFTVMELLAELLLHK